MRFGLSQDQQQVPTRSAPDMTPPTASPTTKEIPYDYVAKFTLKGQRGNRVQDVINISIEGAFIATAIGYSFIPAKLQTLTTGVTGVLSASANDSLGLLLNSLLALEQNDPRMLAQCVLVKLCGIDFKYSIVDSGSGRELQNQPIHNIAGLGEATGKRPFRPLAKPMLFMPRSTIRLEIEEISEGPVYANAELFIVLHGYKILGFGTGMS
ncbi:MAG TPA: hypothetical protein VFU48_02215 [Nitrospira sp.]|nr:hypothetical protein [Nitrospira sp.]